MPAKRTAIALLACTAACLASAAGMCQESPEVRQFTLQCDVTEHYSVGKKTQGDKQTVLRFTFEVRGSKGRYFDWQTGSWNRIALVTADAYSLDAFSLDSTSMGTSINRRTGEYQRDSSSAGATVIARGRCTEVPLVMPPTAKF